MKKEKYLQIFNYLREFSKLRSNPVRDIESNENQYPEIFWLNDIPENALFENVIRPEFNHENDYWIRVMKPKEPIKPTFAKISSVLEKWIEPSSLLNGEGQPRLIESIYKDDQTYLIKDFPEIIDEFNRYINQKWIEDVIDYQAKIQLYENEYYTFEKLNYTYKLLFRIFNKVQQFGEEYELVIGMGLLNFKENEFRPKIFRHILTQRVDINFEYSQRDSQIYISPNIESAIQLETDAIIDLFEQFDSQNIIDAEKIVLTFIKEKGIESLFDDKPVADSLKMFAERISPDGSYVNSFNKPSTISAKPEISFAPALILRKRDTRSFTNLYEKIIDTIENEQDDLNIPTLNDLIEFPEPIKNEFSLIENERQKFDIEPIFFPKEYNDEQIEIVERARSKNKVLVQGPPGTGKSHTIANLICHLLANGNKILITAYTKRALEVLKAKLPPEFQDLVVNLLSGDSSSIQDLQASVNSITDELSRANLGDYQAQIDRFEKELKEVRSNIATIKNEYTKIKEKVSLNQSVNIAYSGTLTEIAEKLESTSDKFSWYVDDFSDINNKQIHNDLKNLYDLWNKYSSQDLSEFEFDLPDPNILPSLDQIKEYRQQSVEFSLKYKDGESHNIIHSKDFLKLKSMLKELNYTYKQVECLKIDFLQDIISSHLNGNVFKWKQKLENSAEILKKVERFDLKKIDKDIEVSYPSGKSLKQLKNDAKVLYNYLKDGNSLSGLGFSLKKPFLPSDVKERLYFIDSLRINGSPCDTESEFLVVLDDLNLRQDLDDISGIWDIDTPSGNSYFKKFEYFKNLHSDVSKLLELLKHYDALIYEVDKLANVNIVTFNKGQLENLINETEHSHLLSRLEYFKEETIRTLTHLNKDYIHPIKEKFVKALNSIDPDAYNEAINELLMIITRKKEFLNFQDLRNNLELLVPNLVNSIISRNISSNELSNLQEAIYFRHAHDEIDKLMNLDHEQRLLQEIIQLERNEKKLIAKLASKKAWFKVVKGLQQNRSLRQHLDAWVLAVKKIGKTGRGKRALKFRRIAQQEMEYCKDSVPCWIMPLYKVAETIQPNQYMYDYVIIDEASQLGPDAIFLLYISRNIIIVGDDKQTSPEYVGIDASAMSPYIRRYLQGIPRSDYFGTEFSFFDHARFFCDGMTVLREHFRCMPEIIEFSNKLFYAPEGKQLYPLKQYSEDRLEPLISVFCPNGYTEGNGSRIINEPEAYSLAERISTLIKDERYKGKTLGVITLQGNQQSSLIEGLLLKSIGEQEYHKRKIICGNSASFQGDERDIIFLSLVTARNHNRSAFVKPEDDRRFNVAVSRAKEQIWLFHSVELDDLGNKDDLRYKLIDHFKNHRSKQPLLNVPIKKNIGTQPDPFGSWFEVDVYNDIIGKDLRVIPQYEVAKGKYRIDLVVVFSDGTKIAVECDGDKWHSNEQYQNDLMRQKVLERCGWQFFRVRGYEYYLNREKALLPLWNMIPRNENDKAFKSPLVDLSEEPTGEFNVVETTSSYSTTNKDLSFLSQDAYEVQDAISENDESYITQNEQEIIRYLNLFSTGTYVLTIDEPMEADYVLPIKSSERNGYLLQCYESGHVNKVFVSILLSRKIGKVYMNGLNIGDAITSLKIVDSEKILGIFFTENGRRKFKAHLTENISCRELLQLQGMKVIYNDFERIEYKILPLEILNEIERLVFQSFTANGKPCDNNYYEHEWAVINEFQIHEPFSRKEIQKDLEKIPEKVHESEVIGKKVSQNSTVRIKYLNKDKDVTVQFVDYETKGIEMHGDIQRIYFRSPIGSLIIGKEEGDVLRLGNSDYYVKILEIKQ